MDPPGIRALTTAIGDNVRALRERHGLTQAALAEQCSIEPAHFQRVEYGTTTPSLRLLLRLAEALDTEVWQLCKASRRSNPATRRPGRPPKRTA